MRHHPIQPIQYPRKRVTSLFITLYLITCCSAVSAQEPVKQVKQTPGKQKPIKLDPSLTRFCNGVGGLTMAFAKLRDQGQPAWKARRKLRHLLIQNEKSKKRLANRVLVIPQVLAYSNKDLKPLTLFAIGRFMCETTIHKIKYSTALPYFTKAGALCQRKSKTDKQLYGCMVLSHRLLMKEQIQ